MPKRSSSQRLDLNQAAARVASLATGEPVQSRVVLPQQTSPRGDLEKRGVNAWIIDAAQLSIAPDRIPSPVSSSAT